MDSDRIMKWFLLLTFLSLATPALRSLRAQLPTQQSGDSQKSRAQATAATYSEPPQPKPSEAVQKLLDEAEKLKDKRDHEGALKVADRALALARESHDAAGEACAHRERANLLEESQRVDDAVEEWKEAAVGWEAVGDGPGRIEALGSAGRLLLERKPGEAEALLGQALGLTREEKRRPLAATGALESVGKLIYAQGNLEWPKSMFEAGLAIRSHLVPDSLAVASSLRYLGNVADDQGDLKTAAEYLRRALAIREKLAPDSLAVAASLNSLGNVAAEQGDLKAAAQHLRRALAIREKLAPESLAVASSLNNLGIVAREQGDLKAAAGYHRRALAIREKLAPESLDVAASLNNLGNVAESQGDPKAAAEYYRRALAIREKLAPESLDVAASLLSLGVVAYQQGNLKAATEHYRRALAIEEKLAPDSLDVAASLGNLGNVADDQGDPKAAAEYYRRALAIEEKLASDSRDVAASLDNLGSVTKEQGDLKAAAEYHRRALAIEEKLAPDSLDLAGSLDDLAMVSKDSGDLDFAEGLAMRAWRIVQHQAEVVTSDEARQAFGSSTQGYAGTLLSVQVARQEPQAAFVTLEEGRAQALARLLFERQEVLNQASGDLWPRHQEALAKLHRAEEALSQAEKMPGDSPEVEQQRQEARKAYQQARDEIDQLWAEIQKREPRAFTPTLNLAEAARTLGESSALVAFSSQGDEAYALALSGGEKTRVLAERLQLGPAAGRDSASKREAAKRIEKRILGFWDLAHTPPDPGAASQAEGRASVANGRELFDALFPGEIGKLVRQSKRLILSPDGALWQLPFAALVTDVDADNNPHYLGERVAISYTPSLALYAQLRKEAPQLRKGQRPEVLAVGDPDFERKVEPDPKDPEAERLWAGLYPPGARPERLGATAREAEVIAQLYGGKPLTGDQATEAEVRKQIEKADVIHLATHGALQTALPMSSGIVLTPPEKEPAIGETDNDGALQAWEIFSQLKLRAELVVLSACDTARGDIVRGEGVVGLTRALEYAGARSIVATQWSVASGDSTAHLMEEFHRDLRKGEAKDEALKDAMATVRKEHPQPFYWAPFILLGDPDNPNLGRN